MNLISKVPTCMIKGGERKTIVLVDHGLGLKTIRQMPNNYCIAFNYMGNTVAPVHRRGWICDPDLAADKQICLFVFELLMQYELRHDVTGQKIMDTITDIVYKPANKLDGFNPKGFFTSAKQCPYCEGKDYYSTPLMRGGINCLCKKCNSYFHICAF